MNSSPFPEARVELITETPERVFKFILGSYGTIKGAPLAIVFIGKNYNRHIQEEVGYIGEGIALEAETLGLATCWMTGTYHPMTTKELVKIKGRRESICRHSNWLSQRIKIFNRENIFRIQQKPPTKAFIRDGVGHTRK